MQDTALVALFTGTSSAIVLALAGGWQLLGESRRAAHERRRVADAREAKRTANVERRLRRALAETRSAVFRLVVTVRVCMDIRQGSAVARYSASDLPDALTRARTEYLDANVAIEALWTLTSDDEAAKVAIDELQAEVATAYGHVSTAGSERGDPNEVERRVRAALRSVSRTVCPPVAAQDESAGGAGDGPAQLATRSLRRPFSRRRSALAESAGASVPDGSVASGNGPVPGGASGTGVRLR